LDCARLSPQKNRAGWGGAVQGGFQGGVLKATGQGEVAPERNSWMKMMDSAMKLQAQLATKLRLATTARHDARTLSRLHAAHRLSYYDVMDQDK
jgi:hypothetical protein